ncbi:hypothetical protein [Caldicellulosiruptor acetigenus]|nr:hypothetical protein [Caldicellulosiruptor acetigenus]
MIEGINVSNVAKTYKKINKLNEMFVIVELMAAYAAIFLFVKIF